MASSESSPRSVYRSLSGPISCARRPERRESSSYTCGSAASRGPPGAGVATPGTIRGRAPTSCSSLRRTLSLHTPPDSSLGSPSRQTCRCCRR